MQCHQPVSTAQGPHRGEVKGYEPEYMAVIVRIYISNTSDQIIIHGLDTPFKQTVHH